MDHKEPDKAESEYDEVVVRSSALLKYLLAESEQPQVPAITTKQAELKPKKYTNVAELPVNTDGYISQTNFDLSDNMDTVDATTDVMDFKLLQRTTGLSHTTLDGVLSIIKPLVQAFK